MKRIAAYMRICLLLLAVLLLPVSAFSISFSDSDFSDWGTPLNDWGISPDFWAFNSNSTATHQQIDGYLQVQHELYYGNLISFHWNNVNSYDPSLGAIIDLDFSEKTRIDKVEWNATGGSSTPFLIQDGNYYVAKNKFKYARDNWDPAEEGPVYRYGEEANPQPDPSDVTAPAIDPDNPDYYPYYYLPTSSPWINLEWYGLSESDFYRVYRVGLYGPIYYDEHPDFSAAGGNITFGTAFLNNHSYTTFQVSRYIGIDDWSVNINAVPEPATMLLFGSGLIGLAGYRKRTRRS